MLLDLDLELVHFQVQLLDLCLGLEVLRSLMLLLLKV